MNVPVNSERSIEKVPAELVTTEPELQPEEKMGVKEFTIHGDDLVAKIKELIHQGNIRRIILKDQEGRNGCSPNDRPRKTRIISWISDDSISNHFKRFN